MPLLGKIINRAIHLKKIATPKLLTPAAYQTRELTRLLKKAVDTEFGKHYRFREILNSKDMINAYREAVPVHDYDKMFDKWWQRTLNEEENICWPGKIEHFALSSGTTGASSKHIPVSHEMTKSIQRAGIKQIFSLADYDLPDDFFETGMLLLGGSTKLSKKGNIYEGDMSGISASQIPFWFQGFYKPDGKIAEESDWNKKLEEIAQVSKEWKIGIIGGIPAWVQLMIEKVLAYHNAKHIHEVWPDFRLFIFGGTAFRPYLESFETLLGKPVKYMETYIASEGYIAYQKKPDQLNMNMLTDNRIYFEFIPFSDKYFGSEGELLSEFPEALSIHEVESGIPYALLLSTCSGAWRYLIGDVIEFDDTDQALIRITGRTKHFLSLCGEHLSVDNMNQAIQKVKTAFSMHIREFTVTGFPVNNRFGHRWFIGTKERPEPEAFKKVLEEGLMEVNDDYKTKRASSVLQDIEIYFVDPDVFYAFMEKEGKAGGQNKFPRVLRGEKYQKWHEHAMQFVERA